LHRRDVFSAVPCRTLARVLTPRRLAGLAVLGVLLVLLVAAAGGSGRKRASAPPPTPTSASTTVAASSPAERAAFIAQANAICTQLDTTAQAIAPSGTDLASFAKQLPGLVTALQRARTNLAQLHPPSDAASLLGSYVALLGRQIQSAQQAAAAAAANDEAGFTRDMQGLLTGQEQPTGSQPSEMVAAARYGLTACAQ
jgi:hypothetical protein